MFHRLGELAARHPWSFIAAWVAILAVAVPLAPQAGAALRPGGYSLGELEAARARHVLERELGVSPSALVIVIRSETDARAGDPAFEAAVNAAIAGVERAPHVTRIVRHELSPRQVSADRRTVYEIVGLDLPPDDSPDALGAVQSAIRQVPGITVYLAGSPAFYGDMQLVSEQDLQRSEIVSLPLAALALLLVFGGLVAAGVPLVVGGSSVIAALALIFLVATATPMSIFVLNLATLLGLGLGVDYSLLMTSRFREELAARGGGRLGDGSVDRPAVAEAVAATVATAGRAVFFSGVTVLLGVLGLLLFGFMILRSVGIAGAIVVALAVASALTLLPAVLAVLGPRLEAFSLRPVLARLPGSGARSTSVSGRRSDGAWARLARWVMDRPVRVFLPTLAFLLLLGTPFLHVRFNAPDASILPPSVPSRQAFDLLVREFGQGEFAPLSLAVRTTGPVTNPANVAALYEYSRRLAADPRVTRVEGIVDLDPRLKVSQYQLLLARGGATDRYTAEALAATTRGDLTVFSLVTPYGPNHPGARALVRDLRDTRSALAPPPGVRVLVGGGAAEVADVVDRIAGDFPRAAIFVLVTTYLVLFVLLRSVVLPAKALVMNTLSILASFGALVWVFQDGNLSALLGFQPLGFVETSQPVVLFCVLFGLSMDYEVFLLSRMKEVYDRTGDNREAVAAGLERSGRIVTSAALIVVLVAGSFAFAEIVLIKTIGVGMAVAVALDATVVRALLVPATMRLLGKWNWWMPGRLARWIATRLPVAEGASLTALAVLLLGGALVLTACSPGGRLLANEPSASPSPPERAAPTGTVAADPRAIVFPRDEGPHRRLTEWWYYTGHLRADDGRRYGFEFVVFRAERGVFPVTWASHLALTDETGRRFLYDHRSEIGRQVDRSPPGGGFDLALGSRPDRSAASRPPWRMAGRNGRDVLTASTGAFGIDLRLDARARRAVLHDRDGYVDFGPSGGSYYYSRTRVDASGTVTVGGRVARVEGLAWFDHQWGDFISVGGGWDWFAVNLADGSDLTVSVVRDDRGRRVLAYGTLVRRDGSTEHLPGSAFTVQSIGRWTSPRTRTTYPAAWILRVPSERLVVRLTPTVADQELDTRGTTGVVYWEGSQRVAATRAGRPLGGEAYVELTGYAPLR